MAKKIKKKLKKRLNEAIFKMVFSLLPLKRDHRELFAIKFFSKNKIPWKKLAFPDITQALKDYLNLYLFAKDGKSQK